MSGLLADVYWLQLESHTPDTLLSVEGVVDLDADKSVPLPSELEQEIKIKKGSEPLGNYLWTD